MKKKSNQRVKDQNIVASINRNLYSLANYLEAYVSALRDSSTLKNSPVAE